MPNSDKWNLHKGFGPRCFVWKLAFTQPMISRPLITLSLAGIDCEAGSDCIVNLSYRNVCTEGFTLLIESNGNAKIRKVKAHFFAVAKSG